MSKIKIIKVKDSLYVTEFARMITEGEKIILKVKAGKRWKFKKFRVADITHGNCESCGPYCEVTLTKGDKVIEFSNHMGYYYINSVLSLLNK